ncbi:MAG: hypothetical protein O3A37_00910 [Planctomycetota bacterium]|jgi:hypothetical protein|nr:hypothetical protein [Planctomycetota bacterium]
MSVIRVGSTHTYANGWDAIFGGSGSGKRTATKKTAKKAKKAKAAKKAKRR